MEEEEQEMMYTLSDHRHIQKMSPISIFGGWIEENQKFFRYYERYYYLKPLEREVLEGVVISMSIRNVTLKIRL